MNKLYIFIAACMLTASTATEAKGITAGHVVAGAIGYAIGSAGKSSNNSVQSDGETIKDLYPYDCDVEGANCLNFDSPVSIVQACASAYGVKAKYVGFKIVDKHHYTILCDLNSRETSK